MSASVLTPAQGIEPAFYTKNEVAQILRRSTKSVERLKNLDKFVRPTRIDLVGERLTTPAAPWFEAYSGVEGSE